MTTISLSKTQTETKLGGIPLLLARTAWLAVAALAAGAAVISVPGMFAGL